MPGSSGPWGVIRRHGASFTRVALLGAVGLDYVGNVTRARYSVGSEFTFTHHVVTGIRVDHRTGQRRDPSVHLFLNGHVPFGPGGFRQAFRIQLEQRLQKNSNATLAGLSHISRETLVLRTQHVAYGLCHPHKIVS